MSKEEEAKNFMLPILDKRITPCIQEAFNHYKEKIDPELKVLMTPRTTTNVIYDLITDYVTKRIINDNIEGIKPVLKVTKRYNSLRILCDDKYRLIFKKVDKNHLPTFSKTKRQKRYVNQENDPVEMDNMPESTTNLIYGWQKSTLGQSSLYLLCTDGYKISWEVELIKPEEQPSIPEDIRKNSSPANEKRVKPKTNKFTNKKSNNK